MTERDFTPAGLVSKADMVSALHLHNDMTSSPVILTID